MPLASIPLALALLAAPSLPAAPAPQDPPAEGDEVQRLETWPELERDTRDVVRTDISRLRKARTPEMAEDAEAALVVVGAAIVPELLPTIGKERDDDARERMRRVPAFVRGMVVKRVEAHCRKQRIPRVTVAELDRIRSRMPASRVFGRAGLRSGGGPGSD